LTKSADSFFSEVTTTNLRRGIRMSMIVRIELGVLEVELSDRPTAAEIDLALERPLAVKAREAFVAACAQAERELSVDRCCPVCRGRLRVRDTDRRRLVSLAGAVEVPVRRFECEACGERLSPMAELLPRTRHTLPVIERALLLATEVGYAKSSHLLRRLAGIPVSHEQIRRLAIAESARVDDSLERETAALFSQGICPSGCVERTADDTVVIAMDGGLVADRASGTNFEARVGVVWCGTASVSKGRRTLLGRRAHAGLEGTTEFAQHMSTLAIRAGMLSAGRTVVIGDGAGWIRRTARDWFPGAVYVLDLYHLKHRIGELLCRDGDERLREDVIAACLCGRPDQAAGMLRRFDPGSDARYRDLHARLISYIEVNAEGIRNYTRTDLFGSGSVEKAVDVIVSRRFKCRGMSWLRPGAQGMLKLKLLRFNDDWDAHWAGRYSEAA
jgi:hypothetical protein